MTSDRQMIHTNSEILDFFEVNNRNSLWIYVLSVNKKADVEDWSATTKKAKNLFRIWVKSCNKIRYHYLCELRKYGDIPFEFAS